MTIPPQPGNGPLPIALRPLGIAVFRRFWIASIVANFGTMMQAVAAAWLMGNLTGGDPQMVALVQTATTLPMMLFALFAGALADIVDRRTLMLAAQSGMALVSIALAFATYAGFVSPALLFGATFLIAAGNAVYSPAWQASVVEQVDKPLLEHATSLNSVGFNIARSVGPAIGGALIAAFTTALVFVLNGLTNIGLILAAFLWKRPRARPILPPEPVFGAVASGLRYAGLSPTPKIVMLRASIFGMCGSCVLALTPSLARNVLAGSALSLGILLGGFGAGAILGAIARANLKLSRPALLRGCTLLSAVGMAGVAASPLLLLSAALMFVLGAAWVAALTSMSVTIQIIVPRWVVGRMIALNQMMIFTGMTIGSLCWGYVAQHSGVRAAFAVAAAAMALSLLLDRWFALPEKTDHDLTPQRSTPLDTIEPPSIAEAATIVVTLEYRVRSGQAAAFVEAMEELGRVRRRDGARRWSLQQDMDDPDCWVERFVSGDWTAHLRRQLRPTIADQPLRERVGALIEDAPVVRRLVEATRGAPPLESPTRGDGQPY